MITWQARPGKGCCDQILSPRMLLSKRLEFWQPIYILKLLILKLHLIQLVVMHCGKFWKFIECLVSLLPSFVHCTQALNVQCELKARTLMLFQLTRVRQGAISSPVLFSFAIDWVIYKAVESCRAEGNTVGISLGDQQIRLRLC